MGMFGTLDPSLYDPQSLALSNIGGANPYAPTSLAPQQAAPMLGQMPNAPPPAPVGAPAKPNFFAPDQTGGRIANILGYLGGGLAQAGGGQDTFSPMMEQRRLQQWQMSKQFQQQQLEFQRQMMLEQYKQQAGLVGQDDNTRLMLASGLKPGTPEWSAKADELLAHKYDPVVITTLPSGQIYNGPQSGLAVFLGGGGQSVGAPVLPTKPVGKLRPMPGGPTPPASGTFP